MGLRQLSRNGSYSGQSGFPDRGLLRLTGVLIAPCQLAFSGQYLAHAARRRFPLDHRSLLRIRSSQGSYLLIILTDSGSGWSSRLGVTLSSDRIAQAVSFGGHKPSFIRCRRRYALILAISRRRTVSRSFGSTRLARAFSIAAILRNALNRSASGAS